MRASLVLLACAFALPAAAQYPSSGQTPAAGQSDWERAKAQREWSEEQAVLPAYPAQANLLEFSVTPSNGFRFYIDTRSLSVGKDGVVRYALVARSESGAENITYEGLRCADAEYRIYAVGRAGEWAGRAAGWRPIAGERLQLWRGALYREYFCAQNQPIRDAADGIRALQRGGHPFARGDLPRGR